ncbi:hypothetical protein [Flavobacterium sp.]|uniref:hypothetical protein n=1 Tax=Flavobacterium sp. TaxID=239 RepID=UPI00121D02EE|nr:hypothetical protein [Flavobacterium sp.]RZJ69158.1 MAG: hypothetical protein EOO49_18490 [Flavobacterium sp.]
MSIIIGTLFAGQTKTQNGQYIATKMFVLGIPLFPTMSMFVTKKETLGGRYGFEIPKNTASIVASYLRILTVPALIIMLVANSQSYETNWTLSLLILAMIGLMVYIWFFLGKTTDKERFSRTQFGKVFEVYFMPEWLYYEDLERFHKSGKALYELKFPDEDWEEKLKYIKPSDPDFALVYCRAYLEIQLHEKDGKRALLDKKFEQFSGLAK